MDFIKQLELLTAAESSEEREKSEFYILQSPYCFRAWKGMDIGVFNSEKICLYPLTDLQKTAVQICNGRIDINCFAITKPLRKTVLRLEKDGVVRKCEYGTELQPSQKLRTFDVPYRPTVKWALTGRCNMKCKHCFLSAPDAKFGELSYEECMRLIDEMAELGVSRIGLTGGEPLLRPDFFEIVDALTARNIKIVGIATNGLLVNERLVEHLKDRGLSPRIFMSYDGTEGWHDWLRGIDGAEKMLMSKFELLAKHGFYTGSAMTIHKLNKGVIRESVNRLASVGVRHVILNRMTNFGEWEKYGKDFNITPKELYAAFFEYIPQYYADGCPVEIVMNRFFRTNQPGNPDYQIMPVKQGTGVKDFLCLPTHNVCYLTADGQLMPCLYIASQEAPCVKMPNISNGLKNAFLDENYVNAVDLTIDRYFEHNADCRACPHARLCMGGCRAHALETNPDDYLAKDYENCMFFHENYHNRIYQLLQEVAPHARCLNYFPEKVDSSPIQL